MPRLPSADDLRLRTSAYTGNVVGIRDTSAAPAISAVAETLQGVAQKQIELDNDFRVASAKSKLLIGQETLLASLTDADYKTYEKRYEDGMRSIKEQAAKMIDSPRDLAVFENETQLLHTRGLLDARSRAAARETDVMRAEYETDIAGLGDSAMTTSSLPMILESANETIDGAVRKGYITAEAGAEQKRAFAVNVATRRLEMLPPEAMIAALDNHAETEAGLLPADVRQIMKQKAQAELLTQRNLERTLQRQAQEDTYERAYEAIIAAGGDLSKVRLSDYPGLRPSQYDSLTQLAAKHSSGYAPTTDPDEYYQVHRLFADPARREEAIDYPLSDKRHLYSESDYKSMVNAQAQLAGKVVDEPVVDAIQSEAGVVDEALRGMGIATGKTAEDTDVKRAALFMQMVEQRKGARLRELRQTNQKMTRLPQEELRAIVDTLTAEVITKRSRLGVDMLARDDEAFAFEQEVPQADREMIIDALEASGRPVNEAAIRNLYIDMQRARGG